MKEYGMIVVGSGSAVAVLDAYLREHPDERGAVIEKDTPGGICLTRGCIPSKLLIASADVVRTIDRAREFGVNVQRVSVDFPRVMQRMHDHIDPEIGMIRQGLSHAAELEFYPVPAEFVGPNTLEVAGVRIHSPRILLALGSEPLVPPIPGLREAGYLTSDTVFRLTTRPDRLAVLGGGYIAAEFAHFFAAMGSTVTVIGRNPRFLPQEEPEVSQVVAAALGQRLRLLLGRQVTRVETSGRRGKTLTIGGSGTSEALDVDEILVATGRGPTTHLLHPERSNVQVDAKGWVVVNDRLETSQPGIWALGDATGKFPFKHKANYDAKVLYEAIVRGRPVSVDYHAVPHAVFTEPEVASVGLTEAQATDRFGAASLLIGRYFYRNTAKGEAIGEKEGFVKVIVLQDRLRILGAHIVGPQAAILLQEVVNLLYTRDQSAEAIREGMHIHPALSEVVERAFLSLEPAGHHHSHSEGAEA